MNKVGYCLVLCLIFIGSICSATMAYSIGRYLVSYALYIECKGQTYDIDIYRDTQLCTVCLYDAAAHTVVYCVIVGPFSVNGREVTRLLRVAWTVWNNAYNSCFRIRVSNSHEVRR